METTSRTASTQTAPVVYDAYAGAYKIEEARRIVPAVKGVPNEDSLRKFESMRAFEADGPQIQTDLYNWLNADPKARAERLVSLDEEWAVAAWRAKGDTEILQALYRARHRALSFIVWREGQSPKRGNKDVALKATEMLFGKIVPREPPPLKPIVEKK